MKVQLHRVRLDGSGDRRLTDPTLTHRVTVSPDGRYIIDVAQAHDRAPFTQLLDDQGRRIAFIAGSQTTEYDRLGLKPSEMFTFTSADGATQLHGLIDFPSDFDPGKRYPLLLSVYGGPATNGASETFALPSPLTEFGFLVARMDARTAGGRGRRTLDAIYKQFTVAEVDDFAAGLRALANRPYVDANRIGVYGTSYGGTVSAALLMRYPELVRAAVSNSPVTDYRLYDTAYSERYLGLPDVDKDAYDRAALLTYAPGLKGDLMLYFGTSDDNVHPKNTLQLIRLLQSLGKSFDVQVGPDRGHTSVDQTRMMEFFIERLAPRAAD
jgi:dipeptidyl-peptidase-4